MNWISALFYVLIVASALRWNWRGAILSAALATIALWLLVLRGDSSFVNWLDVPLFFGCGALTVALGGGSSLEIAFRDSLTGLPNGAWLREKLGDETRRAAPDSETPALLVIGIDDWKRESETGARDEKLRIVAQSIRDAIRVVDLAARLHNEEFAALLPQTDEAGARLVAERIRRNIQEQPHAITVSVGVVETRDTRANVDGFLHCGDLAMFEARRIGGNRVVFYDAEMHGA